MNFRLKPLRFTYVILLGVFLFGCATVDYTKQKPPLFVDYNYMPIRLAQETSTCSVPPQGPCISRTFAWPKAAPERASHCAPDDGSRLLVRMKATCCGNLS